MPTFLFYLSYYLVLLPGTSVPQPSQWQNWGQEPNAVTPAQQTMLPATALPSVPPGHRTTPQPRSREQRTPGVWLEKQPHGQICRNSLDAHLALGRCSSARAAPSSPLHRGALRASLELGTTAAPGHGHEPACDTSLNNSYTSLDPGISPSAASHRSAFTLCTLGYL